MPITMLEDKYGGVAPTSLVPPPVQVSKLECDYDKNPTVLYQALEAKQWKYAISLIQNEKQGKQSATWVVRKETNGKLRWRLLPLHAAIIFGAPIQLIELLLEDYPTAAQCKDDQGMLPLHLAFRNESNWEIIEELLTAFPQAIFVSDRKARTPLQCGARPVGGIANGGSVSAGGGTGGGSVGSIGHHHITNESSKIFKCIVNCIDLYSQISVSGERQRAQQDARKLSEARMAQIQAAHLNTLTTLKKEWNMQQEESKKQLLQYQSSIPILEQTIQAQQMELQASHRREEAFRKQLEQFQLSSPSSAVATTPNLNTIANTSSASAAYAKVSTLLSAPTSTTSNSSNNNNDTAVLRSMVERMVKQQEEYHDHFSTLMAQYTKLVEERQQIQQLFFKDSQEQVQREVVLVQSFKNWLKTKEKQLQVHLQQHHHYQQQQMILEQEEKKMEHDTSTTNDCNKNNSTTANKINNDDSATMESLSLGDEQQKQPQERPTTTKNPLPQQEQHQHRPQRLSQRSTISSSQATSLSADEETSIIDLVDGPSASSSSSSTKSGDA